MIARADEDKDEHDHPWNFISIILKGGYLETSDFLSTTRRPGSIAYKRADESHRVVRIFGKTYSLAIVWGKRREWGYQTNIGWVEAQEYRRLKNARV